MSALLEISGLCVSHARGTQRFLALEQVGFALEAGEVLAVVGESGSGKSTLLASIPRLFADPESRIEAGSIRLAGRELAGLPEDQLRALRGSSIGLVFQDAQAALNPVLRVGMQVTEGLSAHAADALALLARVGLPEPARAAAAYPHQLSGGMRQRALLALALARRPKLLLADEPTSALDPVLGREILALLCGAAEREGMGLVLVTHEIGLALRHAQRVAVMYAGRIVEIASAAELARQPRHPYSAALLAADPARTRRGERFAAIPGSAPAAGEHRSGCAFAPRCARARERCTRERPLLESGCACFFPLEVRP
ncbi:MAG: ABC transporter ATP-binding protein [Planctomycetes bacterium]|nr:ABC transporter ATP-binding protein [Planctomycetota bacterium]